MSLLLLAAGGQVLGGLLAFGASRKQAQNQLNEAYTNDMLKRLEAERIIEAGKQRTEQIRFRARRVRGTQIAQQAAGGVIVNEGSAAISLDDTTALSEADALVDMYSAIDGQQNSLIEGRFALKAGKNNARASIQAGNAALIGSLAGAGGKLAQAK